MSEIKISIWTWGYWYYNFNLIEKLNHIEQYKWIRWIEIFEKHLHKFSRNEIEKLKKYNYNTFHLSWYNKNEKDWYLYCIKTIPNFQHFVLHPDVISINDIDPEVEAHISFENMDPRKKCYQTPEEMIKLFNKLPNSTFTYDINHAEENWLDYSAFDKVKFPKQLHFSVVNKNYYSDNPEIKTPHALACLEEWFKFDIEKYRDCIITMEWVFVPWKDYLIQKEINLIKQLSY